VGVPVSFDGSREGPTPPAPATGWPSGYPITVYAKGIVVTSHVLTKDGDPTPLAHTLLTPASGGMGFLKDDIVLYADAPLASATLYHVTIGGTYTGGTLSLDWAFTTK
jgi:hypothetical protein